MNNSEYYGSKIAVISAIPDAEIIEQGSVPARVYIQEAENLFSWCQNDKEKLEASGLAWSMVEDLPARIGAYSEAQSRWATQYGSSVDAAKLWAEKSPAGKDLRSRLLHDMRFAYKDSPLLSQRLGRISRGTGNTGMIQSLNDLSILGKENTAQLQKINFDMSQLDLAASMSAELRSLLGNATTARSYCSGSLKIRDQAYTHLKEVVDHVRQHGKYAFWREPARYRGYASDYYRKLNRRAERKSRKTRTVTAGIQS